MLTFTHPEFFRELPKGVYKIKDLADAGLSSTRGMRRLLKKLNISLIKRRNVPIPNSYDRFGKPQTEVEIFWPGNEIYCLRVLKYEKEKLLTILAAKKRKEEKKKAKELQA